MAQEVDKVLVIGGAGYIGSALVQRLLELGYEVMVLDLLVYGDQAISEFYDHPKFNLIEGDFRNSEAVIRAAKGMDAIVHLGAIVGDLACDIDQDLTIDINLKATRTIAQAGQACGAKRLVFASTCSVYGANDAIVDEASVLHPLTLYARTKMESEKVLLRLSNAAMAPTILRFGTIYGLSGRPRFDLIVNILTAKAIQEGVAYIFGGKQWRPLVHVRDVAQAIILCLQAPACQIRGQIFNIGSNEQNYQIAALGPIIKELVSQARIITQPVEDERNYRVNFDKIRTVLNFRPQYSIRDGVQEILDAFSSGQISDYRDARYSNVNFLSQNGNLQQSFPESRENWDWIKLSATDAMMLTEVVMAVTESRSQELKPRLQQGLVQALLGNIDGFLGILTGIQLTPLVPAQAGSDLNRPPGPVDPWSDGRSPTAKPASP